MTSFDPTELYASRLLVFLEESPQSNRYHQVLLSPEEYKAVSMAMGKVVKQDGDNQTVEIELSDQIFPLPDLTDRV